ncbi:hypothetical protein FXO38_14028 [Capsicum annuum]|nr:hypothetical protein FXO38_14028 [Capsicum annuum]
MHLLPNKCLKRETRRHNLQVEATESSNSSGGLYEYLAKGNVDPKEKKVAKGKKVVALEDSSPRSLRRKNSITSPPYSSPPLDTEDDVKSSSDMDPLLAITTTLMPIVKQWGSPDKQKTFNDRLHRLLTCKIKQSLYLKRRLTTTGITEFPRFEESFCKYGFEWMMRVPENYNEVQVREFYVVYKEVQEILGIDEMIEATKIIDLGLIRDAAKPMAREARRATDMMAVGADGSRTPVDDTEKGVITESPCATVADSFLIFDEMHVDDSGIRSEGPHTDVVEPVP